MDTLVGLSILALMFSPFLFFLWPTKDRQAEAARVERVKQEYIERFGELPRQDAFLATRDPRGSA